jgi:hypothetical protein
VVETPATELPPRTRVLAELLAEMLDLAVGAATIELVLEDGRLLTVFRKEKVPATRLDRFDRRGRETSGS